MIINCPFDSFWVSLNLCELRFLYPVVNILFAVTLYLMMFSQSFHNVGNIFSEKGFTNHPAGGSLVMGTMNYILVMLASPVC
jgi:hypothetical protein